MDTKCRTCSREDNFEAKSVNAFSERHQEPIYLMLIYCTQLQYSTNDTLPQQICPECLALLEDAFTFWKQSRQTDANLRYEVLGKPQAPPPEPEVPPVPAAETMSPEAAEPASPPPQSFWCCFRKCPVVMSSRADMEEHAKLQHFTERVANEVQRVPRYEHVCSVCCAGFNSRGSLDWHLMIQLGARQKGRTSAIVRNKKRQREREEEKEEPKVELEGVETTVVKEELDLDDWSMDKEEIEAEDVKIDECQDEPMDETSLEKEGKALFDSLFMKLAEAYAKTQDHFQIPLTNKEYLTLRERTRILQRFKKAAISRYKKWMRLMITCERCKFQTNIAVKMQQHAKKSGCQQAKRSYALATYSPSVQILVCVPCGYETNDSYSIRRHQRHLGHEGIDISRSEPSTSKPVVGDEISTSSIQFEMVPVKDEPFFSEEGESSPEASEDEQGEFDCTHCGREMQTHADKQRHLLCECPVLHSKDGRYTCEHCKVVSTQTVKGLKKHMRTDCPALQGKSALSKLTTSKQCNTCQRTFTTSEGLIRHAVFCTTDDKDNEKFTCPNCGSVYKSKYNFKQHLKLRACEKDPNQCKNCCIKFLDINALKRHRKVGCPALLNVESGGNKIIGKCERCGKAFATKRQLRLHKILDGCGADGDQVRKPGEEGKIQCPYCFVQHSRPCNLKRHLQKYCLVLLKKQAEAERAAAVALDTAMTTTTNVPVVTNTGTET